MLTQETELLTYAEAATILKLPIGSLYGLVSKGIIPHIRLSKRIVRFDRAELQALIESNRIQVMEGSRKATRMGDGSSS